MGTFEANRLYDDGCLAATYGCEMLSITRRM